MLNYSEWQSLIETSPFERTHFSIKVHFDNELSSYYKNDILNLQKRKETEGEREGEEKVYERAESERKKEKGRR